MYAAAASTKGQKRPPRPSGNSTTRVFMITPPETNPVILASYCSGIDVRIPADQPTKTAKARIHRPWLSYKPK